MFTLNVHVTTDKLALAASRLFLVARISATQYINFSIATTSSATSSPARTSALGRPCCEPVYDRDWLERPKDALAQSTRVLTLPHESKANVVK